MMQSAHPALPGGTELGPLGRLSVVPADDRAGRSLGAVVAILAFLASLAAGLAALAAASSAAWRTDLAREATIQVRSAPGRDLEADVAKATAIARGRAGIDAVRAVSRREAERLLEPWLGRGLDLAELPVPRLIVVELDLGRRADLRTLAAELVAQVPTAALDDHVAWLARLGFLAGTVVALAASMVVLVLAASAGAIAFAIRGAIAGHRDVVEVLHFVGADDRFIARTFARRFAWLGFVGGTIGAAAAAAVAFAGARVLASNGGTDLAAADALPGAVGIDPRTYAAMAIVPVANLLVAGGVTVAYVKRFLKATY